MGNGWSSQDYFDRLQIQLEKQARESRAFREQLHGLEQIVLQKTQEQFKARVIGAAVGGGAFLFLVYMMQKKSFPSERPCTYNFPLLTQLSFIKMQSEDNEQ
ncbi:uncharacterized protein LOC125654233 [Ostrea edulis]|uniref:uncharacterized protein LOC125654233 n=1 Tax=Ostrea edulis TaxID=37623 RepID=UPI0024AF0285|nr:uncharacterized protein LOC125654233 [Ostrea edulis]